jgi:hypothetical protein
MTSWLKPMSNKKYWAKAMSQQLLTGFSPKLFLVAAGFNQRQLIENIIDCVHHRYGIIGQ